MTAQRTDRPTRLDPLPDGTALGRLMGVAFSPQQLDAITAPVEPGVIIAGAGSGKTTVMAARVVWLVATGQVRREEVLGLTFTNKAAAVLRTRIRQALAAAAASGDRPGRERSGQLDDAEPTVATYHAFASSLIVEHGLRLGIEPDTRLLADASRFQLADLTIRSSPGPFHHLWTHRPTLVTNLLALDDQLREHLVAIDEVRRFDRALSAQLAGVASSVPIRQAQLAIARREELLSLVAQYRQAKHRRGVMDFADQMALGATIAEECPDVGAIERARYRIVLLDEYQDTSVAQRRMLVGLFAGEQGRGHPVTAVGDPCQCIYGWRGASVSNLDGFPTHFPTAQGAPASTFPLNVNRRSGRTILEAANRHARPLHDVHRGVEPLAAPEEAGDGEISVALHTTYAEEIAWVADEVARVHQGEPALSWCDVGILVHDNTDVRALHEALVTRDIPVEVVGLGGLLAIPEVSDVVATLEVVQDLNANAALLRLLTGPRWRIGPRDLALLGRRARVLAAADDRRGAAGRRDDPDPADSHSAGPLDALELAVSGVDPTELVSLADALDDPGGLAYSEPARDRFSMLSGELRELRRYAGEPLVDLVRRVIDMMGLDQELAACTDGLAAIRRDNIASFVEAVATFAGADSGATLSGTLSGLLAYLRAEEEYGRGLAVCAPTTADSVKLLTVHKAKGLEWEVVFLPVLVSSVFPSSRGRARWISAPQELPWPLRGDQDSLPRIREWSKRGVADFTSAAREHDLLEERRLGYVGLTRPRRRLVASGHWWGPTQVRPRGPSAYLEELADGVRARGLQPHVWAAAPDAGAGNPAVKGRGDCAWPEPADHAALRKRERVAALVHDARRRALESGSYDWEEDRLALGLDELARLEQWDLELDRLVDEIRADGRDHITVPLPGSLSTTQVLRLHQDPAGLARELARPMPRIPSEASRFGTRFHAWVESHVGQQQLLDPTDLPGAADQGISDDADLKELCQAFQAGPYGDQSPFLIEAPFALVLGRQVVRGRIDAAYATPDGYEVVDWKTSRSQTADPLQLAIYRLAVAELTAVPLERVRAAFYYVRSGDVVRPGSLPGRAELERLLATTREP
jgi:DNA helicase-2/ATP-dependent DNA helicase PcrA